MEIDGLGSGGGLYGGIGDAMGAIRPLDHCANRWSVAAGQTRRRPTTTQEKPAMTTMRLVIRRHAA